jgi:hypothetical protein
MFRDGRHVVVVVAVHVGLLLESSLSRFESSLTDESGGLYPETKTDAEVKMKVRNNKPTECGRYRRSGLG